MLGGLRAANFDGNIGLDRSCFVPTGRRFVREIVISNQGRHAITLGWTNTSADAKKAAASKLNKQKLLEVITSYPLDLPTCDASHFLCIFSFHHRKVCFAEVTDGEAQPVI